MERTKFAQMKQEPHEWEGKVKEQGRRLDYCDNCKDQLLRDKFISRINKERLMSKLLDRGHRDKATKEIAPFKTVLQIARNFEQCEKAKAVMQQAKGPTEQINYAGARKPPISEKNWPRGKVNPVARANYTFVSIVQGHITPSLYMASFKQVKLGCGRIYLTFCLGISNGSTPLSQPFRSHEHQTPNNKHTTKLPL